MNWRLHGGNPILVDGNIGISDDCCCEEGCYLRCAPYTSFDVTLTVEQDSIEIVTPACILFHTEGTAVVPRTQPICWPFAGPLLNGPFPNTCLPWWQSRRYRETITGLKNLEFSVNLPLTEAGPFNNCCSFIPSGSPSTIDGMRKRFDLGVITHTEFYRIWNYFNENDFILATVTTQFQAYVWLEAGCVGGRPNTEGARSVNGYGQLISVASSTSLSGVCECGLPTSGQICMLTDFPVPLDQAGSGLGGLINWYDSNTALAVSGDWFSLMWKGRTGNDCVQSTIARAWEMLRYEACNTIPKLLVRGSKSDFVLTVEAAP